jgi:serine phosphatase RsbU (regulator of sigma subunit)
MPDRTYITNAILLCGAGVLAAAVARQIRQHIIAALAEAETRRKLDRMEYDLRTARSIQMGLLPKNPSKIAGYDVAGFSEPADQTRGDFYDWFELPGGRVMFTIADAVINPAETVLTEDGIDGVGNIGDSDTVWQLL